MKRLIIVILMFCSILLLITPETKASDPPTIEGPEVIYKQANRVLTISTILPLYTSTAGEVIVIEDDYTGFGNVPGIYTIKLGVDGEEVEKDIQISVRNLIGNVIAVSKNDDVITIHLHKSQELTPQAIINVLVNIQFITVNSTTEIAILTDTYSDNSNAPGTYTFEFHLATTAGTEETHEINLQVNNTEQLIPDVTIEKVPLINWPNLWENVKEFAVTIIYFAAMIFVLFIAFKLVYMKKKKGASR